MKKAKRVQSSSITPVEQLKSFINKFNSKDQRLIRSVRAAIRKRLPTANELVYHNYNFFVIGYSPNERPSDSILSIPAQANSVGLCFIQGDSLADPDKILQGTGEQTRAIAIESPEHVSQANVEKLIAAAIAYSIKTLAEKGRGKLIIRSISAKQRPRKKP